jgi:flagellar export protein FliJ
MSTLDSLIRLHRWQLDERRRRVAELETLAATLRGELDRLEVEQVAEQQAAQNSPEASFAYGSYAGAMVERRRKLKQSLSETEQQAVKAREALAEVFQEVKRYEIASAKRILNQRVQADRVQQHDLDEIAIDIHRRAASK